MRGRTSDGQRAAMKEQTRLMGLNEAVEKGIEASTLDDNAQIKAE